MEATEKQKFTQVESFKARSLQGQERLGEVDAGIATPLLQAQHHAMVDILRALFGDLTGRHLSRVVWVATTDMK